MFYGVLKKMDVIDDSPIRYFLRLENDFLEINQCIDRVIKIQKKGEKCLSCLQNKMIFRQGFCKNCFFNSPLAGQWIINPEQSKAHLNIEDRNIEFEKKIQLQPHILYLSLSSGLKVGITRKNQLNIRWIDQGAKFAIPILELPNRYLAGKAEVELKNVFSDKTNWRKMLTNDIDQVDWDYSREMAIKNLSNELKPYILNQTTLKEFHYPIDNYPKKVQSIKLNKLNIYKGRLIGVKGQYLIFNDNSVLNIRGNEGIVVDIEIQ
tara:strand:- start:5379 stop:6170 length:792 start_codon:yes stop_codon:yes gene_type:complete